MFQKKWLRSYALVYAGVVLAGLLLLYAAGLLPQRVIHENIRLSAVQFEQEGHTPYILNSWNDTYRMDAFSESLILNHSYFMDTRTSPLSIIENLHYRSGRPPVTCLLQLAEDPNAVPNQERSHYWLGYRAIVRPLLCLMPYQDIRGVISLAFFAMLMGAMFMVKSRSSTTVAACLGLTVLAMNPVVVSTSLQYSCCFFIAFAGVMAVCLLRDRPKAFYGAFLVLGQATAYFDFYTAPAITWGIPLAMALAMDRANGRAKPFGQGMRMTGGTLLLWGAGYGGMWLLKLLLTTLLTEQNGFESLHSLLYYTGVTEAPENLAVFTVWQSLLLCLKNVLTVQNRAALVVLAVGLAAYYVRMRRHGKLRFGGSGLWCYAFIALVPVVWIMCMRQASGRHSYFQYRILAASVCAALCFAAQALQSENAQIKE